MADGDRLLADAGAVRAYETPDGRLRLVFSAGEVVLPHGEGGALHEHFSQVGGAEPAPKADEPETARGRLCRCGCGRPARPGSRYAGGGHWRADPDHPWRAVSPVMEDRTAARWLTDPRRILLVRYAAGESFRAIAERQGVTPQAVQQRVHAAAQAYGVNSQRSTYAAPDLPATPLPTQLITFYEQHHLDHGTGCWLWDGHHTSGGHGTLGRRYARHFAFETFHGPIPPGHWVSATCRNPACVNPDHLFTGTPSEVMARTRDRSDSS